MATGRGSEPGSANAGTPAKGRGAAVGAAVAIVAVVLVLIVGGWGLGWYSTGAQSGTRSPTATAGGAPIQHVVVILLENQEVPKLYQQPSEFSYLAATYGNATQFYPACHGSMPNYLSLTSGEYYLCGNASVPVTSHTNLPDLLQQAGYSWGAYFQDMATPCDGTSGGGYIVAHNPFLNYKDIVANTSRCDSHVLNSAVFDQSLANGTLANVSWYVPNETNNCDLTSLAFCSTWLQGFLGSMLNSTNATVQKVVAHTAFLVTFDEGTTNLGYSVGGIVNPWCQNVTGTPLTTCGGHSYLAVVSPYSLGTQYTAPATDFSIASTIEWLFGLGSTGGYDGTANFPAMTSLFSFSSNQ